MIESQGAAPESLAAALADWGDWNVCFHLHIHHPADYFEQEQDKMVTHRQELESIVGQ